MNTVNAVINTRGDDQHLTQIYTNSESYESNEISKKDERRNWKKTGRLDTSGKF